MIRAITLWSFVGLVLAGLFYAGHLLADSNRPAVEGEYPPLLERMPTHPGEPLQFADEAARQLFMEKSRRPRDAVAEAKRRGQGKVASTIYMSYSPSA